MGCRWKEMNNPNAKLAIGVIIVTILVIIVDVAVGIYFWKHNALLPPQNDQKNKGAADADNYETDLDKNETSPAPAIVSIIPLPPEEVSFEEEEDNPPSTVPPKKVRVGGRSISLGIGGKKGVSASTGSASNYQNAALKEHNKLRAKHKAPHLVIDNELNEIAMKCAKHYEKIQAIDHSCPFKKTAKGEMVGENLYMRRSKTKQGYVSPKDSDEELALLGTQKWYEEIQLYNYNKPGFNPKTGHFTAMVWKACKKFGIGVYKTKNGGFIAAMYTPHPNIQNKYPENVVKPK